MEARIPESWLLFLPFWPFISNWSGFNFLFERWRWADGECEIWEHGEEQRISLNARWNTGW